MKRNSYLCLIASLTWVALVAISCGRKGSKEQTSTLTAYEQAVSKDDSVEVKRLVDTFFSYAKDGNLGEAAAMLYRVNPDDPYSDPELLDNEEMKTVRNLLGTLSLYGHKIDYIKFHDAHENEVKCTIYLTDPAEREPALTSVFYLKPIDHLGQWYLCFMDSPTGNSTIVSSEKRDSVETSYQD